MRRETRDEKESILHARRKILARAVEWDLGTDVRAKGKSRRTNSAHFLKACRVDARQDIHVIENCIQLTNERLGASVGDSEAREARNVMDIVNRDRH